MTGIDELARTAGEELRAWRPPEPSPGSPAAAAARTLHRRRVRRVAAGVAAAVFTVGLVSWQWPDGRDQVETGPPASQVEPDRRPRRERTTTTTTERPGSSATTATTTDPAPVDQTTETSTVTQPEPQPTAPPPAPSVRDIDFGSATYPAPCPAYDGRSVTLSGGGATVPQGGARLEVSLDQVSYADADGDGDEDAVVALRCIYGGASTDTGALFGAYRAGPDARPEPIGAPRTVEHVHDLSASGLTVTVTVDQYDADDPACCPSSGAEQAWRFDGQAFQLQSSRSIPPPGAG